MCNRIKGLMISEDFKHGYTTLIRVRCNQWVCRDCGVRNGQRWRAYLLKRFNEAFRDEAWCFFTITANRYAHKKGALETLQNLQQAWKRLYDRLRRRYGDNLLYVRVFEQHKSGRYHMHFLLNVGRQYDAHDFLINSKLDEFRHPECRWLSNAMKQLKAGWRVHIRRVWEERTKTANVGLVVGYILKYMNKNMSLMDFPKRQRRIQTSRRIGSPQTDAKGQGVWVYQKELPQHWLRREKPLLDMSTGEVLTLASWEGEAYYPPWRYYKGDTKDVDLLLIEFGGKVDTSSHLAEILYGQDLRPRS